MLWALFGEPAMFLSRLIYASRATEALAPADIEEILDASRRNNGRAGVTGILIFSSREFLQCLEGSREAVNQTYARILGDPRHADVQVLDYREVDRRLFPEWGMHALAPAWLTRQRLLRYGERELFAPTRMSAGSALALLKDLARDPEAAATLATPATVAAGAATSPAGVILARLRAERPATAR
jgi:hypothetical protein